MSHWKIRKHFSAAHFYNQPEWSIDKNQQEFGKCNTEYGHGHDYVFEIEFSADDQEQMCSIVAGVIESLDHQHLNFEIPHFKNQVPTTENIALYIQKQILARLGKNKAETPIQMIRLFETPDIWVELQAT